MRYLKVGLAGVLVFVGAKMALASAVKISPLISLAVVAAVLGASVLASVVRRGAVATDLVTDA